MTADLDLSPEAVEQLAEWCALHDMRATGSRTAATLRALSAENTRLRAERDAAWQAGAEAMREVASAAALNAHNMKIICSRMGSDWISGHGIGSSDAYDAIRALPLPDQPKEDAPPFQAPTLDDLLAAATDDEADAIRACAERLAETEGGA